jgi:hypothetical protein
MIDEMAANSMWASAERKVRVAPSSKKVRSSTSGCMTALTDRVTPM